MKLSKLNHCAGSTVINGAPQSVTSWFCGSSVILGALWRGQYGSPNFSTLTSPPPSTPHKRTDLHPLSLLHPQPTGKCLLSYCAFCKTWLNLINAVDFKQNCIWAAEREREREGIARDQSRSARSDRWEDWLGPVFARFPPCLWSGFMEEAFFKLISRKSTSVSEGRCC